MKAMEERNAARGLRVVAVTKEDDKSEVESAAKEHAMSGPSFLDVGGAWLKAAKVSLAPAFLLLDREGRLAYRHAGKLTVDDAAFKEMSAILEKL